ncbi:MAG: formyltransferase family protein [Bacteroidales bacterium]|nr:formyltransferase family protein [Bacteroidales bacterium]
MDKLNVIYCGNIAEVADEIFLSEYYHLLFVIVEKGKISSDILTFSYIREVDIIEVNDKQELEKIVIATPALDAVLVCGFGIILSKVLLLNIKAYNFHPGKLPDYKGRHPTFFATLEGEKYIYVTLHEVTTKIDGGRIIDFYKIKNYYKSTENDIMRELPKAVEFLLLKLKDYIVGTVDGIENIGGKYYFPVTKENKTFTAKDKPSKILRILKAQSKYGGGILKSENELFKVDNAIVDFLPDNIETINNIVYKDDKIIGIYLNTRYFIRFTSDLIKIED